jgi:hypothetical protein
VRSKGLVSRLAYAQVDGDHLGDEEILWLCATLLLAGNESTRNAMAGGLEALSTRIPTNGSCSLINPMASRYGGRGDDSVGESHWPHDSSSHSRY